MSCEGCLDPERSWKIGVCEIWGPPQAWEIWIYPGRVWRTVGLRYCGRASCRNVGCLAMRWKWWTIETEIFEGSIRLGRTESASLGRKDGIEC